MSGSKRIHMTGGGYARTATPHVAKANKDLEEEILEEVKTEDPSKEEASAAIEKNKEKCDKKDGCCGGGSCSTDLA